MKYPITTSAEDNIIRLVNDYLIKGTMIPAGTTSDGLTLKNRLLRLFVNKYEPKFSPFYFLHDFLCDLERYSEADRLGSEVMFEIEYSYRTRVMMWIIVKYHKIRYNTKQDI